MSSAARAARSRRRGDGEYLELPGANHFTIIDALAEPGTHLRERVLALAGA